MRGPSRQADPAWGHPTLPGSPEPQRHLLPPSLTLLEHVGPDGHRSEGQGPDSAGDTAATTRAGALAWQSPGWRPSHSLLDPGP